MKTAALACLLVCGCHGSSTPFSVLVDPPAAGDAGTNTSCIGVVGFEVAIHSGSETHQSGPLLNLGPVLDAADCRIATPYTVEGLALDQPISVTVTGYDSAHVARVTGTSSASSIGSEPLHVPLAAMSSALLPVILEMARTPLLGTTPLSDVTSMVVATVGGGAPMPILTVDVSMAGLFFTGVEPGAFGIAAAPPMDLTATFAVKPPGTAPPKARLTAKASTSGLYWQTTP